MKRFADLYRALDASTATADKRAALVEHLQAMPDADAAWAVYFLAGGKPRQMVPTRALRALAQQAAGLPEWLFEESYQTVGDLAETVSLLLPPARQPVQRGLAEWLEHHLLPLRGQPFDRQLAQLQAMAPTVPDDQRLVWLKLVTGGFRVGVSRLLVTQALAQWAGVDTPVMAQRLMGTTAPDRRPTAADHQALLAPTAAATDCPSGPPVNPGQPYPFFLAHALNEPVERLPDLLGNPANWLVEWKWDGIRAQLVRRCGQVWLWSRGEELVTERFPELAELGQVLPDGTVLDGEVLVWRDGRAQPFAELQPRIGRARPGPKLRRERPVVLLAYDLLEWEGQNQRDLPLQVRRVRLESVVSQLQHPLLPISPLLPAEQWAGWASLRAQARALGTEGLMLKSRESGYGVGRTKAAGVWWKWKIDPMTVDAVLIYAQRGHGRRASLYSDYTFAVWNAPWGTEGRQLVPFAKAYSGLTDAEMAQVDAIIRRTTVEQFGPVRSVTPTLVFELGFEGLAPSTRHKSGLAVRFPRMLRWRQDKPIDEADTLQTLAALLPHPVGANHAGGTTP